MVRGDRNGQMGRGKKEKGIPFTRDSALSLCIGSSNLSSQSCIVIQHLCSQSFACKCVCDREREGKLELSTVIKALGREGKETAELKEGLSAYSPCFCILAELESSHLEEMRW